MRVKRGLIAALALGALVAGCGAPKSETASPVEAPATSTGDAMASDAAAPPAGEAVDTAGDTAASAPDSARPDFGEPGAKATGKK